MKYIKKISGMFLLLLFGIIMLTARSNDQKIVTSRQGQGVVTETPGASSEELLQEEVVAMDDIYLLTDINSEQRTIELYDPQLRLLIRYDSTSETRYLGKFGNTISDSEMLPGTAVTVVFSMDKTKVRTLQKSDAAWVNEEVTNYTINSDENLFKIGQTSYRFDENVLVYDGQGELTINDIGTSDTLIVTGINKEILSIFVNTGTGQLKLVNTELFNGSLIMVGDKIIREVSADLLIPVSEGTYTVTVANNGYGGSTQVEIQRNSETVVDLDTLKGEGPKFCTITFEIEAPEAVLSIDGKEVDASKPVDVQYGTHLIQASAEGFDTVSNYLVVNSETATIQIGLTQEGTSTETGTSTEASTDTDNNTPAEGTTSEAAANNTTTALTVPDSQSSTEEDSEADYLSTLYQILTQNSSSSLLSQ
ncbi:MAG: hypothetical protein ACK5ML_13740 [Lachnospiraceae bacterium]